MQRIDARIGLQEMFGSEMKGAFSVIIWTIVLMVVVAGTAARPASQGSLLFPITIMRDSFPISRAARALPLGVIFDRFLVILHEISRNDKNIEGRADFRKTK